NAKCYLEFKTRDSYHLNEFHLFTNGKKADV
nr:hypothetical protein [Candidatus Anoxychlamydiales bacterium]